MARINNIITVSAMIRLEQEVCQQVLELICAENLEKEVQNKLKLQIVEVDKLENKAEAALSPSDDNNFMGTIAVSAKTKNRKLAIAHEVMHYIFSVGNGNKVTKTYYKNKKGKNLSLDEQEMNYRATAFIMPYDKMITEVMRYDRTRPKIDEVRFVRSLQVRFDQTERDVINRIHEVRKLYKARSMSLQ